MSIATDLALTAVIVVGGAVAIGKLNSMTGGSNGGNPITNKLPGGNDSPINNNPPSGGGSKSSGTVPASNKYCDSFGHCQTGPNETTCDGALAVGSQVGKQVFIAPLSEPLCGDLTTSELIGLQSGYIDPSTGGAIGTDTAYIVWRCVNKITSIDDGWFYLSPFCQGY